jgi:hypothetical protein
MMTHRYYPLPLLFPFFLEEDKGAPQHGAPDAGLSIRGLALTELSHITVSAGYSNRDQHKAHRNQVNA